MSNHLKPQKSMQKPFNRLNNYFACHLRDALSSLGELWHQPFSSLMILMVIGISLALPLSFLVLIKNLTQVTDNLSGQSQITLFLKADSTEETAKKLQQQLGGINAISKIHRVAPDKALTDLITSLNIQDAIQVLPSNPLPWVLILTLSPTTQEGREKTQQIEQLLIELQALPEVEKASLDLQWLKRLSAVVHFAESFVTGIAFLLSLAILLVIGNTISLYIENRRQDIEIVKLIGATDAFVRRPFLYLGIWYGFIGSIFAIGLVMLLIFWLGQAAKPLLLSYQSDLVLKGLDISSAYSLLILGLLLGFGAAWLSVSRHLRSLRPQYS